jgi:hypothetical protein
MKKNMGTIDRVLRIILALIVLILYGVGSISGAVALVLGIFAVIFLLTSITGVCPLYGPLGISTIKKEP